jgi:hypothetical protein
VYIGRCLVCCAWTLSFLHPPFGSCLKCFQLLNAKENSRSSNLTTNSYTCPACRAAVQSARPNPIMKPLLENPLTTFPDRRRTPEQKDRLERLWKKCDSVLLAPKYRWTKSRLQELRDDTRNNLRRVRHTRPHSRRAAGLGDFCRGDLRLNVSIRLPSMLYFLRRSPIPVARWHKKENPLW